MTSLPITVAVVQFCPQEGRLTENLQRLTQFIDQAAAKKANLVLLPEICDLGYNLDIIQRHAESFPNRSTETLAAVAQQHGIILIAGLAERRGKNIFNTAVMFDQQGRLIARYDKTHLCPIPPANEQTCFQAGDAFTLTTVLGVRMGMTICYDVRFPEIYRKLALDGCRTQRRSFGEGK